MSITETASGASSIAVEGNATGAHSVGARGTGEGAGVVGKSEGWAINGESHAGVGVRGVSQTFWGVDGESASGVGVRGVSQTFWGVDGESASGAGVRGVSNSGAGVIGESHSGQGVVGSSDLRPGVEGQGKDFVGVWAESHGNAGIFGITHKAPFAGVSGQNDSSEQSGVGVSGVCEAGIGVFGKGRLAGRFQGDVEVTGDIRFTNAADCAEDFDVADPNSAEPGTVMVLSGGGELRQSHQAYDKRVAGVVSGGGDYKPGIILDKRSVSANRRPIALLGKVYVKVDAQFGAVEVGDLLTSSPTPGHAMRIDDPMKAFGATIGKALRPLTEGRGLIPILIALQ